MRLLTRRKYNKQENKSDINEIIKLMEPFEDGDYCIKQTNYIVIKNNVEQEEIIKYRSHDDIKSRDLLKGFINRNKYLECDSYYYFITSFEQIDDKTSEYTFTKIYK